MANAAPAALPYALSILRSHGTIVLTAGPRNITIDILEFIWRDIVAVGTQNGTASDMESAAKLCMDHGIQSMVKLFEFSDAGMQRMLDEVHGPEWSGKAVVRIVSA